MSNYKRKKLLIDPATQLALARSVASNWLCFLALVILLAVCMETIVQYPNQSLASLAQGVCHRHAQTFILILLTCPLFIFRSIKFSHRFAGPIWRLRHELRRLKEGSSIQPIHFRKGDFWTDLAEDFNAVLRRLERAEQNPDLIAGLSEGNATRPASEEHELTPH
jgi:hypothetical protein